MSVRSSAWSPGRSLQAHRAAPLGALAEGVAAPRRLDGVRPRAEALIAGRRPGRDQP